MRVLTIVVASLADGIPAENYEVYSGWSETRQLLSITRNAALQRYIPVLPPEVHSVWTGMSSLSRG